VRFSPALLTDLYELTMLQAYFEEQMSEIAVFSLFVRRLPERRNLLLRAAAYCPITQPTSIRSE
jgi:nicotinate phosphoribosyltransferase